MMTLRDPERSRSCVTPNTVRLGPSISKTAGDSAILATVWLLVVNYDTNDTISSLSVALCCELNF